MKVWKLCIVGLLINALSQHLGFRIFLFGIYVFVCVGSCVKLCVCGFACEACAYERTQYD